MAGRGAELRDEALAHVQGPEGKNVSRFSCSRLPALGASDHRQSQLRSAIFFQLQLYHLASVASHWGSKSSCPALPLRHSPQPSQTLGIALVHHFVVYLAYFRRQKQTSRWLAACLVPTAALRRDRQFRCDCPRQRIAAAGSNMHSAYESDDL